MAEYSYVSASSVMETLSRGLQREVDSSEKNNKELAILSRPAPKEEDGSRLQGGFASAVFSSAKGYGILLPSVWASHMPALHSCKYLFSKTVLQTAAEASVEP